MVVPNELQSDNALAKATNHYLAKARAQVQTPGFVYTHDARAMHRRAERVTNQLAVAEQKDKTPELLVIDGYAPASWMELIDALLKAGYPVLGAATVESGKPARARVTSTPLVRSLDALDGLRRRLISAINGNTPQSEAARELRGMIFGGRTVTRSRADYETEYELVIASIRELEKNGRAPKGVLRMLSLIEPALATLKALPPTVPGRQPATPKPVPVEVQVTTLALHLALGDLLSHAASTATDARLNSLSKVINARAAGEVGSVDAGHQEAGEEVAAEEPVVEAPAEETRIVVVQPGPVASGETTGFVNGEAEEDVAAVVAEVEKERRGRQGRRRD